DVGQAFIFNGNAGCAVQITNPAVFQIQDLTIEAWVQRSSSTIASHTVGGAQIFGFGSGGYILEIDNDGHCYLGRNDISGIPSSFQIADTSWHHLAVTRSGSSVVFYLDGTPYPAAAYGDTF